MIYLHAKFQATFSSINQDANTTHPSTHQYPLNFTQIYVLSAEAKQAYFTHKVIYWHIAQRKMIMQ